MQIFLQGSQKILQFGCHSSTTRHKTPESWSHIIPYCSLCGAELLSPRLRIANGFLQFVALWATHRFRRSRRSRRIQTRWPTCRGRFLYGQNNDLLEPPASWLSKKHHHQSAPWTMVKFETFQHLSHLDLSVSIPSIHRILYFSAVLSPDRWASLILWPLNFGSEGMDASGSRRKGPRSQAFGWPCWP